MLKDRDAFLWFVLLLAFAGGSSAAPSTGPNLPAVQEPWLYEGVYWWCAKATDAEKLVAWFKENESAAHLVRMLGTNGGDCAIVLFQVSDAMGVRWTLGGPLPEKAPNGLDTTLDDLRGESKLREFFRRMAERTWEQIKRFDEAVQQWMQQHMPSR